jgi:hypothetical protein
VKVVWEDECMKDELGGMWLEAVAGYFKVKVQNLSG